MSAASCEAIRICFCFLLVDMSLVNRCVQVCGTNKQCDLERLARRDVQHMDKLDDMPPLIQVYLRVSSSQ